MSTKRVVLLVIGWLAAVVLAVTIGVATVSAVDASMRGRGPIGDEVIRSSSSVTPSATVDTDRLVTDVVKGDYGEFEVGCSGAFAVSIEARPAPGWQLLSHDPGPDDDVDATFTDGTRKAEVEVFCNQGKPTLAELEYDELAE
ncbi:hypothetical protein [Nocardioides sp.]|uniref:hypothetical protein n=1 Tax=Nocardioides sp. TaxID=35761 RepID=UPI0039E67132